jgi:hypothetical protein
MGAPWGDLSFAVALSRLLLQNTGVSMCGIVALFSKGVTPTPDLGPFKLRMAQWNEYMRHLTEREREHTLDA